MKPWAGTTMSAPDGPRGAHRGSAKPSAPHHPRRPSDPLANPALTELRRAVDDLAAATHQLGELMLEVVGGVPVRH